MTRKTANIRPQVQAVLSPELKNNEFRSGFVAR